MPSTVSHVPQCRYPPELTSYYQRCRTRPRAALLDYDKRMGSPARSRVAFTSRHLPGLGTGHGTFALRDGQIGVRLGLLATRG